jgi:5-methylcytosine-specific restriction endonuclease McrA
MKTALLLNATYEPLRVIPITRAIVLVLMQKAEVIAESDEEFRSERKTVPIPSVVRLLIYREIPYMARVKLTRSALFKRDKGTCGYCGRDGENIDHIMPKSRGGKHRWENVVVSCKPCNSRKADRTPLEAGMTLKVKPYAPKDRVSLVLGVGKVEVVPDWEPFLAIAQ